MSCLTLLTVKPADAQVPTPPDVPTLGPIIICDQGNYLNVSSPQNRNYPNNPIQLTFTITVSTMLGQFGNVGYSIDGGVVTSIRNLPLTETRPDPYSGEWYYYTETASASLDLPQLSDGAHNVTVYYGWQYLGVPQNPSLQRFEVYAYQTVNFTIGTPQPTPSPSPPEFTARFVPSSLEVKIKNQSLAGYVGTNGSNQSLYYCFRFKNHENMQDWNYAPIYYVGSSSYGTYYKASNSDYTVVSFPLGSYPLTGILGSGQIDLQVMALIGNEVPTNYENGTVYGFDGVTSVWSSTQTITIPISSSSPTATPTTSIQGWVAAVTLVVVLAVAAGLLVYFKKHQPKSRLV
jgi:hypothetical protein